MKTCKTCKYNKLDWFDWVFGYGQRFAKCTHPRSLEAAKELEAFLGKSRRMKDSDKLYSAVMRSSEDLCGNNAKLWGSKKG